MALQMFYNPEELSFVSISEGEDWYEGNFEPNDKGNNVHIAAVPNPKELVHVNTVFAIQII